MDLDNLILSSSGAKIKCASCKSYLSFFPIYICPQTGENICGRCCTIPSLKLLIRNEAYEFFAQNIKFPCRYKQNGCLEIVRAAEIPEHENNCHYRIITCPTGNFTECKWSGFGLDLLEHCKTTHSEIFLKNTFFMMDLSHSHNTEHIVEIDDVLFLISRQFSTHDNSLTYSICHLKAEAKSISCQLSFSSKSNTVVVKCNSVLFEKSTQGQVYLDCLLRDNKTMSICERITMRKENYLSYREIKFNDELLSEMKCSVCSEYVLPPIYQTLDNQITCSECKEKCEQKSNDKYHPPYRRRRGESSSNDTATDSPLTRNFNLEKLASLLNYPCKNNKNGCRFVSKPEKMINHQTFCPYSEQNCPASEHNDCLWKGYGEDVITHIKSKHKNIIRNTTQIIRETCEITRGTDEMNQVKKFYIIQFSKRLFRLFFTYTSSRFYWMVQRIGNIEENYEYEIEIIDCKNKERKLLARRNCSSILTNIKDQNCEEKKCIYFCDDQIQNFSTQRKILFKVNILKSSFITNKKMGNYRPPMDT